jgi:hypothetical protein
MENRATLELYVNALPYEKTAPIRQQTGQLVGGMRKLRKGCSMKNHKFWAWATVVCFLITIYTGYKHK